MKKTKPKIKADPDAEKMKLWLQEHETPVNYWSDKKLKAKRNAVYNILRLEREICGEENW